MNKYNLFIAGYSACNYYITDANCIDIFSNFKKNLNSFSEIYHCTTSTDTHGAAC